MPLPTPRTPIRSISYFGGRFLISPLELFCAGAASTGAVSASCVVASGDCCACELPLQTALTRNAVQLHLAMRARQGKLNSGWFVPEQQTERFAMTHPPRGGFYSSDVQLCGQNLCIWPSEQALVAYVAGEKGRTVLSAHACAP